MVDNDYLVDTSEEEFPGSDVSGSDFGVVSDDSDSQNGISGETTIQVASDSVIPVYSSADDVLGNPVAYAVEVDNLSLIHI